MNHIAKIGIELEGYWHKKKAHHKPDRSVHASCPDRQACFDLHGAPRYGGYTGELASRPILVRSLDKWIDANYADHVDRSCGLHVHFSLTNPADYARLMEDEFWDFYSASFEQWGHDNEITNKEFWSRLSGENNYCRKRWEPHDQMSQYDGDRYTQLNFTAYRKHGTIECRMLPMFKEKRIAAKAIWHLISIVNTYLSVNVHGKPLYEWPEVEVHFDTSLANDAREYDATPIDRYGALFQASNVLEVIELEEVA